MAETDPKTVQDLTAVVSNLGGGGEAARPVPGEPGGWAGGPLGLPWRRERAVAALLGSRARPLGSSWIRREAMRFGAGGLGCRGNGEGPPKSVSI